MGKEEGGCDRGGDEEPASKPGGYQSARQLGLT